MASYRSRVTDARRLLTNADEKSWALAQLTYEVVEIDRQATEKQWAKDIGVSPGWVKELLRTWRRFGDARIEGRSFFEHYELARHTEDEAAALIATSERTGKKVSTLIKQERDFTRLMKERGVVAVPEGMMGALVEEALVDPDVQKQGRKLNLEAQRQWAEHLRNKDQVDGALAPVRRAVGNLGRIGLVEQLRRCREDIENAVELDADFSSREIKDLVEEIRLISQEIHVYVARREMDVDLKRMVV